MLFFFEVFIKDRILITEHPPIDLHAFHRVETIAKCDFFMKNFDNIHNNFIYLIAKYMPRIFAHPGS